MGKDNRKNMQEELRKKVEEIRKIPPRDYALLQFKKEVELIVMEGEGYDDFESKENELRLFIAAATNEQLVAWVMYELQNGVDSGKVRNFVDLMKSFFIDRKKYSKKFEIEVIDKDLSEDELIVISTEHFFELNKETKPWHRHRK